MAWAVAGYEEEEDEKKNILISIRVSRTWVMKMMRRMMRIMMVMMVVVI